MRVIDRIENTGNRPLDHLDFSLPRIVRQSSGNLSVTVDGRAADAKSFDADPAAPVRVTFDQPWRGGERREIVTEYNLSSDPVLGSVSAISPEGVYLADARALPEWATPLGVFASGDILTRDETFEIALPADFHVLSAGKQRRKRMPDGRILYSFRTSGAEVPSYVIGGRYQALPVKTTNGTVVFWTFRPIDAEAAQKAAVRLTDGLAIFARDFGNTAKFSIQHVIEVPAGVLASNLISPQDPPLAAVFPHGLLLSPAAMQRGISDEEVLRAAEAAMVRLWFGWSSPLRPEVETLFKRGFSLYGIALAAENRGGEPARRAEIERLLSAYDRAQGAGAEGRLLTPPEQCTPDQLTTNSLKSALFLADLDDLAGQDRFERAVQRMHDSFEGRGLALSIDDFRAALEFTIGVSLADHFRLWLNQPGIPDAFRRRYSVEAHAGKTGSELPILGDRSGRATAIQAIPHVTSFRRLP